MTVNLQKYYNDFDGNNLATTPNGHGAVTRSAIHTGYYNIANSDPASIPEYEALKEANGDSTAAGYASTGIIDPAPNGLNANTVKLTSFSFVRNTDMVGTDNFLTKMHAVNNHLSYDQAQINAAANLFIGEAALNEAHAAAFEQQAKTPLYQNGWHRKTGVYLNTAFNPMLDNYLIREDDRLYVGVSKADNAANDQNNLSIPEVYRTNTYEFDKSIAGTVYAVSAALNQQALSKAALVYYQVDAEYNLPDNHNNIATEIVSTIRDINGDIKVADIRTADIKNLFEGPDRGLRELYPSAISFTWDKFTPAIDTIANGTKLNVNQLEWNRTAYGQQAIPMLSHAMWAKLRLQDENGNLKMPTVKVDYL